jgi:zinc transport system ATP-binding protein
VSATPAIEVRGLTVELAGREVLEEVDLTVPEGDLLGIIGPNGGGKTVLLKVLLGLLRPARGTVRVLGRRPEEARGEVAYVPQHVEFDREFPIRARDVVLMGRIGRRRARRRFDAEDLAAARQALERVDLADLADRQIGRMSGGQLQRVLIARALALDARLLLLDEPTANLDSGISGRIYDLLVTLAGRMTVVLVAHDVGVMCRHVKSIACLNRRLHQHAERGLTQEMLEAAYGYPVDVLLHDHGHSHRLLEEHLPPPEGR